MLYYRYIKLLIFNSITMKNLTKISLFIFTAILVLGFSNSASADPTVIVKVNGILNGITLSAGQSINNVTWSSGGSATICECSFIQYAPGPNYGLPKSCSNGTGIGTDIAAILTDADKIMYKTTTFSVSCTDNVIIPPPSCTYTYPSCFIADTQVTLSNNTKKNIQDVRVGDVLKGDKTNNTVLGLHQPKLNGKLYSFNGGTYFVTEEHPFKTTNGWKSINPEKTANENIGIEVTPLHVGDILITDKGNVLIKTIDSKSASSNTNLYNFMLDGDHTYYADGYLVHNKENCSAANPCGNGIACVNGASQIITDGSSGTCGKYCSTSTCGAGYAKECVGTTLGCVTPTSCSTGTVLELL